MVLSAHFEYQYHGKPLSGRQGLNDNFLRTHSFRFHCRASQLAVCWDVLPDSGLSIRSLLLAGMEIFDLVSIVVDHRKKEIVKRGKPFDLAARKPDDDS